MNIGYLQVIAKYIVEAYFERGDARGRSFFLLQLYQVVFTTTGNGSQLIQLGINTCSNEAAFIGRRWRIFMYLFYYFFQYVMAGVKGIAQAFEVFIARGGANGFERFGLLQAFGHLQYFPGIYFFQRNFCGQPLYIAGLPNVLANFISGIRFLYEPFYSFQPFVDALNII